MPVRVISQRDGRTKTRLYQIYTSMKDRCYRAKARDYARYGARGLQTYRNAILKEYSADIQDS